MGFLGTFTNARVTSCKAPVRLPGALTLLWHQVALEAGLMSLMLLHHWQVEVLHRSLAGKTKRHLLSSFRASAGTSVFVQISGSIL